MLKWLEGKKTFIIAGLILLGGVLILVTGLDFNEIPEFAWILVNAAGLAVVRDGLNSASKMDNKGWKSYLAAGLLAVLGGLKAIGVDIPPEIMNGIWVAVDGFGLVGIRDAVNKIT